LGEGKISTRRAKRNSTLGHLDFRGVEGTDADAADNAVPAGMTAQCIVHHNKAGALRDSMAFHHSSGFPTL
jgi:hypothetical protein